MATFEEAEAEAYASKAMFQVQCLSCGDVHSFEISRKDYDAWRNGTFAQDAFPYLTPDQRELLISRTCGTCFDEMFQED